MMMKICGQLANIDTKFISLYLKIIFLESAKLYRLCNETKKFKRISFSIRDAFNTKLIKYLIECEQRGDMFLVLRREDGKKLQRVKFLN